MTDRPAAQFLRIALRRAARGTGSLPDLYERRTAVQPLPDLDLILVSLRWALVDGIALRAYMPERMTLDVDILVHERDAGAVRAAFIAAGYRVAGQLSIGGFTVQPSTSDTPRWMSLPEPTPGWTPRSPIRRATRPAIRYSIART
jgi:hypothetical protein